MKLQVTLNACNHLLTLYFPGEWGFLPGYNKHEQQLDQKAASSIHDITCQTNFTSLYGTQLVTSVILNLKFMAQDTKLKKSKRLIDWLIDWLIGWFLGWCCCSG